MLVTHPVEENIAPHTGEASESKNSLQLMLESFFWLGFDK